MASLVGKRKEQVSTSSYNTCHPHDKLVMKRCTVALRKCCPTTTVGSRFNRNQHRHTETHAVHTLTRIHTHTHTRRATERERERHTHTHTQPTHTMSIPPRAPGPWLYKLTNVSEWERKQRDIKNKKEAERKRRRLAEKLAEAGTSHLVRNSTLCFARRLKVPQ